MKNPILIIIVMLSSMLVRAQDALPVRGLCISAPNKKGVDRFVKFINEQLPSRQINTLVVMINYNYEFKTHPELKSDSNTLSKADVTKIVEACKSHAIKVIPLIDLLGHQSWANRTGKLLSAYPQFDETPWVKMPVDYKWPNADSLYCKSYCPLQPDVHKVVFDLIDEICDAFQSDIFHAGMDEVFYIGEDKCPRCGGREKAKLFADEVNLINKHLEHKGRRMWIWGDRLIDGNTMVNNPWEASKNHTAPAVDHIRKDVTICDWHYDKAYKTPEYFTGKGLSVISCCWRKSEVAITQLRDMLRWRQNKAPKQKKHYLGIMQTVWAKTDTFLDNFYSSENQPNTDAACFRSLFDQLIGAQQKVVSNH